VPAVRQKFHLSICSNLRVRLTRCAQVFYDGFEVSCLGICFAPHRAKSGVVNDEIHIDHHRRAQSTVLKYSPSTPQANADSSRQPGIRSGVDVPSEAMRSQGTLSLEAG
jgi:hypothetical protein